MKFEPFSVALEEPLETARGTISDRSGWIVGLDPEEDDAPTRGVGEASPLPGWTEPPAACRDALDAIDPATSVGDGSGAPAARHGLALARLDAAARDAGVSLATRLAADADLPPPARSVEVNATIGDGSPGAAARAARRAVEKRYPALKIKVGARSLSADLARVRAVRREVGPAVELRADANGAWDRETARRALDAMGDLGVTYVEQPLSREDLSGHAALGTETDVDVALDESVAEYGCETILDAGAADVVVLKPMVLGGPDRALAAARRARRAGVEPVVTTTIDAVVARTAAVHVAAAIPDVRPCGLATGRLLRTDLAPDPAEAHGGAIAVPDGPGIAGDAFDRLAF